MATTPAISYPVITPVQPVLPPLVEQFKTNLRRADDEAELSQLAFLLGKFPEHFEGKVAAVIEDMEKRYDELKRKLDTDSSPGDHGAGSGVESSGVGSPFADDAASRQAAGAL